MPEDKKALDIIPIGQLSRAESKWRTDLEKQVENTYEGR